MMEDQLFLKKANSSISGEISISGSKSESNRLLILNALYRNPIDLVNLSNSEDTKLLQKALETKSKIVDIHHAGTAMRFLTAYFSVQQGREVILTGSKRMKQRPIGILVDALRSLGAEITYLENEGFPPLKIIGKNIENNFVELNANISSQFITALLLISPKLQKGLTIQLNGKITSLPYLEMTIQMLNQIGIAIEKKENILQIPSLETLEKQRFVVESDWSSVSYFYSIAALSKKAEIKINSFKKESLQGDSKVVEIYRRYFGVETEFSNNQIVLQKKPNLSSEESGQYLELNLNDTPDIAQTIAVTCAGLKMKCKLTGLETLKVKETDRIIALQNELKKIGSQTIVTDDSFEIIDFFEPLETPRIKTYNDHRMAMSFAPYSLVGPLEIENPEVVEKSYPDFWEDLKNLKIDTK